jgi:hypothetical protein
LVRFVVRTIFLRKNKGNAGWMPNI